MPKFAVEPTTNHLQIVIALPARVGFGVAHAAAVRHSRRRDPQHGYTAGLVVYGVAAVLPMVVEFTDFRWSAAERRRRTNTIIELSEGKHAVPGESRGIQLAQNGGAGTHRSA